MTRHLFPVALLAVAAFLCAGPASAEQLAKLKTIIPAQSELAAATGGKPNLPQRIDGEKDQDDSHALISAPTKSGVPGTAGGGSHTDREA